MRIGPKMRCPRFPCKDVNHSGFVVPAVDIHPDEIRILMVSEAAPMDRRDYYYARGKPLFQQTTVQAFNDAGVPVASMMEILKLGVYVTTAVKCAKTAYGISIQTVDECSKLLEREIAMFPRAQVVLAMGDVAIRALNTIARRLGEPRPIPAGSTYKIRGGQFHFLGMRAIPSYLQAGPSFFIEKSKRKMIAQDIATALELA